MKFLNCSLQEAKKNLKDRKIIFFGCGSWLEMVNYTELTSLQNQFAYIVDNDLNGNKRLNSLKLDVYLPEKIFEETNCVIIISSPIYMYDMYCQLQTMNLSDEIHCYAFPFMQMISETCMDKHLLEKVVNIQKKPRIPKMIHCFWFSGEPKPMEYQRCIDTWEKCLLGYEIKEWNMDNYDWHKHPFLERAIETKAWAFAADFARLDVLNEYGGIYLDMDVEMLKPFDELLGNKALLSFSNNISIDLAVLGAEKGNGIIQSMLEIYDKIPLPVSRKEFVPLFQPALVRPILAENGIKMDGSLQVIEEATVFPSAFFMPQDVILYREYEITDYTYCVHYDIFGWSFEANNKRKKKIKDNNLLWNLVENI